MHRPTIRDDQYDQKNFMNVDVDADTLRGRRVTDGHEDRDGDVNVSLVSRLKNVYGEENTSSSAKKFLILPTNRKILGLNNSQSFICLSDSEKPLILLEQHDLRDKGFRGEAVHSGINGRLSQSNVEEWRD